MKINVAELLKGCPKGMELDCTTWDSIVFEEIHGDDIVIFRKSGGSKVYLTRYGELNTIDGKCIIFPKGKTSWEGFVPPCEFKDGDILTNERGSICIYKGPMYYNQNLADFYCGYRISDHAFILKKFKDKHFGDINKLRRVSEIEKQYFFQILSDNGYKWNPETKTLEKLIKPEFKVGDYVAKKGGITVPVLITGVGNDYYYSNMGNSVGVFSIKEQDDWKLAPNKFDITTLKPLESKVLMRSSNAREWVGTIYSHYNNKKFHGCGMYCDQCIPYEGNEHLLGTTDDCAEYYKNW